MSKKRALVLAGGGARGAFQIGMLHGLIINRGLDFNVIRGVSVGALNAAFLAQANSKRKSLANMKAEVKKLENLWSKEIHGNHSVYGERAGGFAGVMVGADSLYTLEPLKSLIQNHLSFSKIKNSGRNFAVGTVSLVTGVYKEWFPTDREFVKKLLASASIPVVFPYVDVTTPESDILVDGGVRNITPLSSAFDSNPEEIYILLTSRMIRKDGNLPESCVQVHTYDQWDDNWLGTKIGGLDVLRRTLDILTDEIFLEDIRGALAWNEVAKSVLHLVDVTRINVNSIPNVVKEKVNHLEKSLKKKRYVDLFVLAPREWYGERNSSTDFSHELIKRGIEHGKQIAADKSLWVWP